MRYRVFWTARARSRMGEIADYIAQDRPAAARALVEKIFDRVATLADLPRAGRSYPGFRDPDVRELIIARYRVTRLTAPQPLLPRQSI